MLTERLYDVSLTFERLPAELMAIVDGYQPVRVAVVHNTAQLRLRNDESRVLALVSALAARGRLLRIEINGASLEDVFVELTRQGGTS
jgi:hypothetical protein